MLKLSLKSIAAVAITCVSSAAVAQTIIEPAPATPAVVAPVAVPVVVPAAAAPTAPVGDVVIGTPEVTLQLHPVTHFGAAKQIFIHGATDMAIYGKHTETPSALGPVAKSDVLALSAEMKSGYFFTDMFAAGLTGTIGFNNLSLSQGVQLHIGPFVALNIPLHHHFSFFPSFAGTYGYANNINKSTNLSAFAHDIELELQLTVLFHVTEHFSVSISPFANQVVYGRTGAGIGHDIPRQQSAWVTTYGAKFGLLFWH